MTHYGTLPTGPLRKRGHADDGWTQPLQAGWQVACFLLSSGPIRTGAPRKSPPARLATERWRLCLGAVFPGWWGQGLGSAVCGAVPAPQTSGTRVWVQGPMGSGSPLQGGSRGQGIQGVWV